MLYNNNNKMCKQRKINLRRVECVHPKPKFFSGINNENRF